jgi:hypothetical protein
MAAAKEEVKTDKKQVYKVYTESENPQDPDRLKFLEVLEECNGLISPACKKFGISRAAVYKWLEEDWFVQAVQEIIDGPVCDHVESKMHEKINGVLVQVITPNGPVVYEREPSDRMIEFFLKNKGTKRNYGDKRDITSGGEKISSKIIINLTDKDDESDPM